MARSTDTSSPAQVRSRKSVAKPRKTAPRVSQVAKKLVLEDSDYLAAASQLMLNNASELPEKGYFIPSTGNIVRGILNGASGALVEFTHPTRVFFNDQLLVGEEKKTEQVELLASQSLIMTVEPNFMTERRRNHIFVSDEFALELKSRLK